MPDGRAKVRAMRCLVTGGAGYIGSHVVLHLLEAGHEVVVLDDFRTGHPEALRRVQELTGRPTLLVRGDVADARVVARAAAGVDVVFHLAASKAVGESMVRPEAYFQNNLAGMTGLLEGMVRAGVKRVVFSSSAAVYGSHARIPISEDSALRPDSPYGLSKAQGEQMLAWMARSRGWSAVSLRYFNPVGAHASGRIGEHAPHPTGLVPRVLAALLGQRPGFTVFGTDYDTPDGTCIRDLVSVEDLARAHLAALPLLREPGHAAYNVGTGLGHSVLEVVEAAQELTGIDLPVMTGPRREGDMPVAVADPRRFREATGFEARDGLLDMIASAWRWVRANPHGYDTPRRRLGEAEPLFA